MLNLVVFDCVGIILMFNFGSDIVLFVVVFCSINIIWNKGVWFIFCVILSLLIRCLKGMF